MLALEPATASPAEADAMLSLAATNRWADACMAKAIAPSKANVQAITVRGAGPSNDKLTVKTEPSDESLGGRGSRIL